jgi:hypothetical protein
MWVGFIRALMLALCWGMTSLQDDGFDLRVEK